MAAKKGLSALALTDHDTINGIEEAEKTAKNLGVGFVPGIELEISMPEKISGEFHLLGLGINKPSASFVKAVAGLAKGRMERNREIIKLMQKANIKASYEDLSTVSEGDSIGRPHFAMLLVKLKVVKNIEQAFKRFLGRGKPFYIPKPGLDFDLAISIIHESGGLPILAHPLSLYTAWGRLPDLIKNFKDRGLDGLEAWHPAITTSSCKRLEDLGNSLELFITAGSDFHGQVRSDRKLGITAGNRKIEQKFIDNIPILAERLQKS